jgi:hypothetical protein
VSVLDGLQGANDQQKRAALAALAQAGQRGLDAYKQTRQVVDTTEQEALARARNVGSGAAVTGAGQQELEKIVSQPAAATRMRISSAEGQYTADNNARQASTGAYFDEVNAAVPLLRQDADNQIALSKQRFDEEQARIAAAAAAKASAERAKSAAEQKAKDITYAQLRDLARGVNRDQQFNDRSSQMQSNLEARMAAENEAWVAARKTPNEMTPEERRGNPMTADRYEATDTKIQGARSGIAAQNPGVKSLEQLYQEMTAGVDSPGGVTDSMNDPFYADQRASAEEQYRSQFKDLYDTNAADVRALEEEMARQQQVIDETERQRALFSMMAEQNNLDPALAMAAFQLPTEDEQTNDSMTKLLRDRELGYLQQTGYRNPTEQAAWEAANEKNVYSDIDRRIAQQAGMDPAELEAQMAAPETRQVVEIAQALIDEYNSTGEIGGAEGYAPTRDMLANVLSRAFADSPGAQQQIPLVLALLEQSGMLYGSSYGANAPSTDEIDGMLGLG